MMGKSSKEQENLANYSATVEDRPE